MVWFRRKPDPISDRARSLDREIAALEAQIKVLDSQLQCDQAHPRLRSPALPHGPSASPSAVESVAPSAPPPAQEPIFEDLVQDVLKAPAEAATPEHYNELGVRKYDLPALLRRLQAHFRGPAASNPKLVNYLAAGGIQGLRPLRYEKRVARNRFIFFVVFLIVVLAVVVIQFFKR
jgi:hypothetical protein